MARTKKTMQSFRHKIAKKWSKAIMKVLTNRH